MDTISWHMNATQGVQIVHMNTALECITTCYELVTDVLNREFVAKILNRSKRWTRIPD